MALAGVDSQQSTSQGEGAKIRFHFNRILGESVTFTEGLVGDDGRRLHAFSVVPEQYSEPWSLAAQKEGLIPPGRQIASIRKYAFYDEYFDVLEYRDPEGELLGYYSDICTPLKKIGEGEYAITDLILDLWIFPDGTYRELDWDEFDLAVEQGLLSPEIQSRAVATLTRLKAEILAGRFPSTYIQ
jgi:hypothetical protein